MSKAEIHGRYTMHQILIHKLLRKLEYARRKLKISNYRKCSVKNISKILSKIMNYENIIKILENYTSSSQQSYLKMKSFMCIKFKSNFYGIRFERNHVPETAYVK